MKWTFILVGSLILLPAVELYGKPLLDSRGNRVDPNSLRSFVGQLVEEVPLTKLPETLESEAPIATFLQDHLPTLESPRGDRWPLLVWMNPKDAPRSKALADALIDRGISPLFNAVSTPRQASIYLPTLRYFRDRGVPLIILPQGLVQRAYRHSPAGLGGDHLPPAAPSRRTIDEMEPNHDFTCPAWLYENPALSTHRTATRTLGKYLKTQGIEPAALLLDFESGTYLRNGSEKTERVMAALAEARKCPRCTKRFTAEELATPASYSRIANAARAYAMRSGFVDPVHTIFPNCPTGNFYAWPIDRLPAKPGLFPAYGYEGSGMNVAQPRVYFTPAWHGAGYDQTKTNWNIFYYCIEQFSRASSVSKPGEILAPWIGYVWPNLGALRKAKRKLPIASPAAYREMGIHLFLRGAKTILIFAPQKVLEPLPSNYRYLPRYELGPFYNNVADIQSAYRATLPYNDILLHGKPLNLKMEGDYNQIDDTTMVWSGIATDQQALIRTVSFGPQGDREVTVFGRQVRLPFRHAGAFFLVHPDGKIKPLMEMP